MLVIAERNVNDAYHTAHVWLRSAAHVAAADTRNGPALVLTEPLTTHYRRPVERVLFDPGRDANPFFHFFESLWMLAGRHDVQWLAQWLPRVAQYSDDGVKFHGAYGRRWRHTFGFDQLAKVERVLRDTPTSRQAVMTMWDPASDLGAKSLDIPCNTHIKFDIRHGALCMMVCCRSNDLLWGAYGANVVHFSMLQEYLATRLGVPVGWYEQISLDAHVYVAVWARTPAAQPRDLYAEGAVSAGPLMVASPAEWDEDLGRLMVLGVGAGFADPFFSTVARPMAYAYAAHRAHDPDGARLLADQITAPDWRRAALDWLARRRGAAPPTPATAPVIDEPERDGLL